MITRFKNQLTIIIEAVIANLEKLVLRLTKKEEVQPDFSSLAPIEDGKNLESYCQALLWAIQNRKKANIKNIALTGPYGSGKSSVLKTFQKKYSSRKIKFLNISLATFKDERIKDENQAKPTQADLLKLIEISILEQIFYHEKDKHVPDSQFRKIKSFGFWKLLSFAIGYLIFFAAISNAFFKQLLTTIFKDYQFSSKQLSLIHYSTYAVIVLGLLLLIYKSVRIISAISVNKLKINDAEIGLGYTSKSIMNKHFDELLYFFSVRPYNVVVIEDLDRFQETEIFTKLRELNLLLNNSEKTKKKEIVFIYAVRDDMFKDNDRTKFFDFIIPVIPIINSSNSSQILLQKTHQFNYALDESFIEDISFFIQDMRLLHNITNEFYLYKQNLNSKLSPAKLFAIITYKNIYPNDFVKLSQFSGDLYSLLLSKPIILRNKIEEIDKQNKVLEQNIKNLETARILNINELRAIYVLEAAATMEGVRDFVSFSVNNVNITYKQLIEETNFNYLMTDKLKYNNYKGYPIHTADLNKIKTFKAIEQSVDKNKSYKEKEKEIYDINFGRANELKERILKNEKHKEKIQSQRLSEILRADIDLKLDIPDYLDKAFITILLRKGYIAEDYLDYISLFHEGSITQKDHQYVISVKNLLQLEYNYPLTKIEKLITKLSDEDFETKYILNYDLIDYFLSNNGKYLKKIDILFNQLNDQTDLSVQFIEGYIKATKQLNLFIEHLCEYWPGIWQFYSNNPKKTIEQRQHILDLIIQFASIKAIENISAQSNFTEAIKNDSRFLTDYIEETRIKDIITTLDIRFNKINFSTASEELIEFIYENMYYEFTPGILAALLKRYGKFDQPTFDSTNYSAIVNSDAKRLIEYVHLEINSYVKNVFLKIEANTEENESQLLDLLNKEELEDDLKKSVITQVKTKISSLNKIKSPTLIDFILEKNKTVANWLNLLNVYNILTNDSETSKELPNSFIVFFNLLNNAEELSKVKILTIVDGADIYSKFYQKVLECNKISNESYKLLIKSSPWWYNDLPIETLETEKVKALINAPALEPTIENFLSIREHHTNLRIKIIEKNHAKYIELIDELDFVDKDIELILQSEAIPSSSKKKFLEKFADEKIMADTNILQLLAEHIGANNFEVSQNILQAILKTVNIDEEQRIKLFISNHETLNNVFVDEFLQSLTERFQQIRDRSIKAIVPNTSINVQFLRSLENKGYISSFSDTEKGLRVHHKRINPED